MGATLVVKGGKADRKQYTLEEGRDYYLGRSRDAEVKVRDQQASRRHCKIRGHSDGKWTVSDQHSSNGTYVNDKRITKHELRDGDVVSIGHARFEFRVGAQPSMEELEAIIEPKGIEPQRINVAGIVGDKTKQSAQAEDSDIVRDTELMELFAFLDQIEDGEPARSEEEAPGEADQEPLLSFGSRSATAPPTEDGDAEPLVSITDEADAEEGGSPGDEPDAKPPAADEEDGLLSFLRKKSQS